jgi:hypothetical protein
MRLDGQTVLHTAVRAGHPRIVKTLIKHAPELKTCLNEQHQTALDLAKSLLIEPEAMEYLRQHMTSEGRETGSSIDYQKIVSALSAE